jgi:chromosome partitioning protein
MGKLIVVGNEKGGVGKSTVACNIAIELINSGADVLLVDTDRQNSLGDFASFRNSINGLSKINCVQKSGDAFDALTDLKTRYDYVLVDAGGQDSVELRSSLLCADLHIMPLKASQFDLWACQRMDDLMSKVKSFNRGIKNKTLINMASTHVSVVEDQEALTFLDDFVSISNKFTQIIHERKTYRDSIKSGMSVIEYDKNSKAAYEFSRLFKEIKCELQ